MCCEMLKGARERNERGKWLGSQDRREDQKNLEIPTDTSREVDASSGDPGDALRRTCGWRAFPPSSFRL